MTLLEGAGVAFSRHPGTGDPGVDGDFVPGASDPRSVGEADPRPLAELAATAPALHAEVEQAARSAEDRLGAIAEVAFVVGRSGMQLRDVGPAGISPLAVLRLAVERWAAGAADVDETLGRIPLAAFLAAGRPRLAAGPGTPLLTRGRALSPGGVVGPLVLSEEAAAEHAEQGGSPVLVNGRRLAAALALPVAAVVSTRGGHASTLAGQARKRDVPLVSQVSVTLARRVVEFPAAAVAEGDEVSVDGATGQIWHGACPVEPAEPGVQLARFLAACDDQRRVPLLSEGGRSPWADDAFDAGSTVVCRTPDDIDVALRADEPVVVSPAGRDPVRLLEVAQELAGYGVDIMLRVGPDWPPGVRRLPSLPWLAVVATPETAWAGRALAAALRPAPVVSGDRPAGLRRGADHRGKDTSRDGLGFLH
jgi:phosphohistidine swiveling domain-containing protein